MAMQGECEEVEVSHTQAGDGVVCKKWVTSEQLRKLEELRKRRLQLKKNYPGSHQKKARVSPPCSAEGLSNRGPDLEKQYVASSGKSTEAPKLSSCEIQDSAHVGSGGHVAHQPFFLPNEAIPTSRKKRQKLHWGLDTKERWERKGNM